ncbi:MAG TPA: DUF3592 domain-containing protein [Candidatus Acidoferrales bacterium]|nr:DUF3592 domain-containing protein [Candidatus Acidoferrales bacterium]
MTRLISGIFLIAGLVAMGAGGYMAWAQVNKNRDWPEVKGTVQRSWLVGEAGDKSGPVYKAGIEFVYTVGGKDYVGKTADSWTGRDRAIMEAELRQYPTWSVHPIRYNPADPTQVQIESAAAIGSFTPAGVAGGIGLCAVVVSLFGLVTKAQQQPSAKT